MLHIMCKAKIHGATVTEANLKYQGSLAIDENLMETAGILPHEMVQVVNVNNGERFETYAITGDRGSGIICLNGAAARLGEPGDTVLILSYGMFDNEEARALKMRVVLVDSGNRVSEVIDK